MALPTMTEATFEPTTFVLKAVLLTHSASYAQAFQMIVLYRLCVEKNKKLIFFAQKTFLFG